jgi:hypothetical protein
LIELAQEEETGEKDEELKIEKYMAKMWKRRTYGARIQHL